MTRRARSRRCSSVRPRFQVFAGCPRNLSHRLSKVTLVHRHCAREAGVGCAASHGWNRSIARAACCSSIKWTVPLPLRHSPHSPHLARVSVVDRPPHLLQLLSGWICRQTKHVPCLSSDLAQQRLPHFAHLDLLGTLRDDDGRPRLAGQCHGIARNFVERRTVRPRPDRIAHAWCIERNFAHDPTDRAA